MSYPIIHGLWSFKVPIMYWCSAPTHRPFIPLLILGIHSLFDDVIICHYTTDLSSCEAWLSGCIAPHIAVCHQPSSSVLLVCPSIFSAIGGHWTLGAAVLCRSVFQRLAPSVFRRVFLWWQSTWVGWHFNSPPQRGLPGSFISAAGGITQVLGSHGNVVNPLWGFVLSENCLCTLGGVRLDSW